MLLSIEVSWSVILAIVLLAFFAGWIFKSVLHGKVKLSISTADPQQPLRSGIGFQKFVQTKTERTLLLKCECGAIWKFAEGDGPHPPGTEPIPTGDSFICRKCGKSIDLKSERELEAEARNALNSGNFS